MSCSEKTHTTAPHPDPGQAWEGGSGENGHGHTHFSLRKNGQEKTPQGRSEVCHVYKKQCLQRKLLLFSSILAKKWGPWWHYYCSLSPEACVCAPEAWWCAREAPLCPPAWDRYLQT